MEGLTQVGRLVAMRNAADLQKQQVCAAVVIHQPHALTVMLRCHSAPCMQRTLYTLLMLDLVKV